MRKKNLMALALSFSVLANSVVLPFGEITTFASESSNLVATTETTEVSGDTSESTTGNASIDVSKISAVYGTTAMTYYQYYQNEVSSDISKNEDGYYDVVTSATKGSHTSDIATIQNWSSNGTTFQVDGIKTVDILITPVVLSTLTTGTTIEQIKSDLSAAGITMTHFALENTLYTSDVVIDSDQKLDVSSIKERLADGSYGKSTTLDTSFSKVTDITDYVKNRDILSTVNYTSGYGDYAINLYYSGEGLTGSGITLANDTDKSIWTAYKNNIYSITFTNQSTGKTYGSVWYEDIWSETSKGSYLEIAINLKDRVIKTNTVKAGRFADMTAGTYTATVKSRGYEDVVTTDIVVGSLLSTKPTLTTSTFSTGDSQIPLTFDTTGVEENYVNKLASATYTLTRKYGATTEIVTPTMTSPSDGKTVTIANNNLGYGTYTLTTNVDGYQTMKYTFTLVSTQEKLALKVADKQYQDNSALSFTRSNPIYLVDADDGSFVSGYGYSATVTVNGTTISSRGSSAIKVLNYDATAQKFYIDPTVSTFSQDGTYEVKITCAGFETYTYTFALKNPTTTIGQKSLSLFKGGNANLTATVFGDNSTVTWTSSNSKVAMVSSKGVVTAIAPGTVTITATANGVSATTFVTVKSHTIALSKTSATIYTAGTKTISLSATIDGTKVSGNNVRWSSSNNSIATVSSAGIVTAKKAGSVLITATANGVSTTSKITVVAAKVVLNKSSVTLAKGKKFTLKTTTLPTTSASYTSSNKKIATVTSKGVITAKKKGTTTIKVTANGITKTVKVTVK